MAPHTVHIVRWHQRSRIHPESARARKANAHAALRYIFRGRKLGGGFFPAVTREVKVFVKIVRSPQLADLHEAFPCPVLSHVHVKGITPAFGKLQPDLVNAGVVRV